MANSSPLFSELVRVAWSRSQDAGDTNPLRRRHEQLFGRWLNCSLEAQMSELKHFYGGEGSWPNTALISMVQQRDFYDRLIPDTALCAERQLFHGDLDLLMRILNTNNTLERDRVEAVLLEAERADLASLTLNSISLQFGVSPDWFRKLFRMWTGNNFGAFLRRLRMKRAAHLLRSSTIPVTEIAVRVGYSASANFIAAFKPFFGLTPRQYRLMRWSVATVPGTGCSADSGSASPEFIINNRIS